MIIQLEQKKYPMLRNKYMSNDDFRKQLKQLYITGKKQDDNIWYFLIDIDNFTIESLDTLEDYSDIQEDLEKLKIDLKTYKYKDFISELYKAFNVSETSYIVIGDIVNEYKRDEFSIYDFLDEHDTSTMKKIKIEKSLIKKLKESSNRRIKALITPELYKKNASIQLKAIDIEDIGPCSRDDEYQKLKSLPKYKNPLENKKDTIKMAFKDKGSNIKIEVICSNNPDNHGYRDFEKQLNEKLCNNIKTNGVNMHSITEIIRAIKNINKKSAADVICIVRGGGDSENMAIYNDERLLDAVIDSKIPVVVGIGHSNDKLLVREIATHGSITPTDAAVYLNKCYYKNLKNLETEKLNPEISRLTRENNDLQSENTRLTKENNELKFELNRLNQEYTKLWNNRSILNMLKDVILQTTNKLRNLLK